jgi:hypothetical protein
VEAFMSRVVRPSDIAYVDFAGFFPTAKIARDTFTPLVDTWNMTDLMSQEERNSVTILILRPKDVSQVMAALGGTWWPTGDKMVPTEKSLFEGKRLGFLSFEVSEAVVYRRR